ncbi:GFA family protein [Undibacterium sp. RuTC16W]|uniref:GFA family protein n=1 Tax=Undibacterium sp. RuTC16W TaxID=3413048 RepID=UPI003BF0A73E
MTEKFVGQCQCAAVNYLVTGTSATLFACHCTDCQRQSASAFGMALWIKNAQVEVLSGELKEWVRHMPSGRKMSCRFCGVCGTRVFHQVIGSDILSIKPGTLNNTKDLVPCGHIWTDSKQEWIHIDEKALRYTGNPENFDALIAAWHSDHA